MRNSKARRRRQERRDRKAKNPWFRAYIQYLKSEHWRTLSRQRKEMDNHQCAQCFSREKLEVHHRVYRNLYDVQLKDIITLCQKCHARAHQVIREWKRIREQKAASGTTPAAIQQH